MDKSKMDNLDPNTANIHTPNSQKNKPKNNQPKNNQPKNNQHKNSQPTNVQLPYEFIDSDAGFNVENDEIPDSLLGLGDDPNYRALESKPRHYFDVSNNNKSENDEEYDISEQEYRLVFSPLSRETARVERQTRVRRKQTTCLQYVL